MMEWQPSAVKTPGASWARVGFLRLEGAAVFLAGFAVLLAGFAVLLAGFAVGIVSVGELRGAPPAAAWLSLEEASALRIDGSDVVALRGRDARRQLVVAAEGTDGTVVDATRDVEYVVEPPGVVSVDAGGYVTPLANGTASVTARKTGGPAKTAAAVGSRVSIVVDGLGNEPPVNFPNQIVPIFTKHGCNSGGCHGKSGGQNGFGLSLLGFYPEEDHEYLVLEARGRRILPAAPGHSLLLLKASNTLPHGGGERIKADSLEYRRIYRWMEQGMPYGSPSDPRVDGIEVFPNERVLAPGSHQQLHVLAHYTDGSTEDVTRMAQFESNDTEIAAVSETGLVSAFELSGTAAVMVRYQAQVGVFRGTVPLGIDVQEFPPVRNFIDELVFAKLKLLGIPAAKPTDDATFARRVTIDIAGRLPTADEGRAFAASTDPRKRESLVDRLLASTDYAEYFANKWGAVLRNKRQGDAYTRGTFAFHSWLRMGLHQNTPYDQLVREIVAATGDVTQSPAVAWYRSVRTAEQQVEDSAQLFLGLRIQCARCHHHPFERWSQRDYYGYSAFFSRVGRKKGNEGLASEERIFHQRGVATATNPRGGESLRPTGLGGPVLDVAADEDPREALAGWMAEPANPFFAPALVNRYWKHFFGRGLVEPEDDMRQTNPATHPDLLKALSAHFIARRFDLKDLVRTIVSSSAYQLDAAPNPYNLKDKQNFSRFYPRRLNAEVLYDAIHAVTDTSAGFGGVPPGTRAVELPDASTNNYFLTVFGKPMADSACECERSNEANLAQSLHLLNSGEILGKLTADSGRAASLARRIQGEGGKPPSDGRSEVEELYYWAYGRPPAAEEVEVAIEHLKRTEAKRQALEDVIWALINTKEFLFNH